MNDFLTVKMGQEHYTALNAFEWVDDWLKMLKIVKNLQELAKELKAVKVAPPTMDAFKARLTESHKAHEQRRINLVAQFLKRSINSNDPLCHLERMGESFQNRLAVTTIELPILLAACDLIEPEGALSDEQRAKKVAALKKKIAAEQEKLGESSPAGYFKIEGGQVTNDIRSELVQAWKVMQERCHEPCNAQGYALKDCPHLEQRAWKSLKISAHVNKSAAPKANPNRSLYY